MKKVFATVMMLFLMVSAVCVTIFAAEADSADVMLVSGLKRDGTLAEIAGYKNHAEGWEKATDLARDAGYMKNCDYARIVVDLFADWNAVNGVFCSSGEGFNYDTIRFYDKTRITLNMNGHTINRGITSYQDNGEVIHVANGADVIINGGKDGDAIIKIGEATGEAKMGTITGGFNCNGAGGIHIEDNARVVLNNVRVIGNTVEDHKGAAIAMYDDSSLIMNGGCLSDNRLKTLFDTFEWTEGTLYVNDSTAVLNKVTISGNDAYAGSESFCAGVCLEGDSKVTLDECLVENNGTGRDEESYSVFFVNGKSANLILNKTDIINNGRSFSYLRGNHSGLFAVTNGTVMMNECKIIGNSSRAIFNFEDSASAVVDAVNCVFTDNVSTVIRYDGSDEYLGSKAAFSKCKFNKNVINETGFIYSGYSFMNYKSSGKLAGDVSFIDCDLGDSEFSGKEYFEFIDSDSDIGSIFGAGSLTLIVAFIALIASVASLVVNVTSRKEKTEASAEAADDDE